MKNQKNLTLLVNYYSLYLKAQCYHWNVSGVNFYQFHKLFETIYTELLQDIDQIAEHFRALGEKIPVSFKIYSDLNILPEPNHMLNENEMIQDLQSSYEKIINLIEEVAKYYEKDLFTFEFLRSKIPALKKTNWILKSILE